MMQPKFFGALVNKLKTAKYERTNKHYKWRSDHVDKFVFIHINKTAGTSIKHSLKLPWEHQTALEKRRNLGPVEWEKRFSFSIVRNPWDRVVSHYHYRFEAQQGGLTADEINFNDWVRQTYGKRNPKFFNRPKFFMPQLDWISDEDGEVMVNAIYRFENLEEDFKLICRKIDLKASLSHLRSSRRGPYRDYYKDDTRALIESWFKCDIRHFGYTF